MDEEVRQLIRKLSLFNAVKHDGKADAKAVIGKLLAERPDLKVAVKGLSKLVLEVIEEVNSLPLYDQRRIIEEKWPELLLEEKIIEKKVLPPLPNVEKYTQVVTRYSPNPDCVLHLGSTRAAILSHDYARMYGGKFYLRFEDTDPRLKRPVLEFYDLIREDLIWLGCKWDEEFIQSERLPIYYEHARKLLEIGGAFVCTCDKEVFRRKILSKQPCPCRNLPVTEQLARWDKMLDGTYEEGDAIVRVKTDVSHPNPAVRDWPALRIIDTTKHPHPRVGSKYHVWPLYNFACGLDDHLNGITHIIRGKEHVTNEARQKYMYMHFGWSYPEAIHYGRLRVVGAALSKSKIMKALADGTVESFSDPRLATLASLRRRGITSEALRRMVIEVGPKPVDVTISWENIYAYNRKIVDPAANRYFFIPNPIIMTVSGLTKDFTSTIALHPNHLDRGYRKLYVKQFGGVAKLAISADDLKLLKEHEVVRLMELFNVKVNFISEKRVEASFLSEPYTEAKKVGAPLIQWLPAGTGIETNVVMPTANVTKGLAEDACRQLSENTIIQFERFGFVKIDKITQNLLIAYYAHR